MSGSPITILLIEDNLDHALLVKRSLAQFKVANNIIHLEDGEVAIDYLKETIQNEVRPHIILLDLRIPKVDGLEVLKFAKNQEKLRDIPIVILTTSGAERDIVQAYSYHANSYLVKPVDFTKFSELMNALGFYWICWNKNPFKN